MRTPLRAALRLAFAGILVVAGAVVSPLSARADVPSEKSLPPTTFFLLKVNDVAKLRGSLQATGFGKLLADPAMQPLKDDIAAKLDDFSQKLKEKIGVTLGEISSLPQGELSLALVARDDPKMPLAILISADAGENAKTMQDVLDKATKLGEDDHTVTSETFKGMKLTILTSKKKDDEKPEPPSIWTRQGTVFHIASDIESLKDVLSNSGGRTESLAASEGFGALQKRVAQDAQVLWYVDVSQFVKAMIQNAAAQGAGNAQQIEAQLQLLGLNGLKAIGGSLAYGVGDFDQLAKIYVYAPGPAQGLAKLFSLPKADLKPQAWVPASVASYSSINWDLDAFYSGLNELLDMFAPGALGQVEQQLAGPAGEEVSFQKDLFGPLGNRITVLGDIKKATGNAKPEGKDGEDETPRTLVAIALDDVKAFQNTLNKAITIFKLAPKKREFQGTTIYDFDIPELPNALSTGLEGPLSIAIAKNHLFFSLEPSFLEQILRASGTSLADDPLYQAVSRQYPDQTSTLSYQEPQQQARSLYNTVKTGKLKEVLQNAQKPENGPDLTKLADVIDPKKLPDFSVFAKYLAQGGGYGVTDEEGATFTSFTIKK
jgi:hypothetical protein